MSHYLVKVKRYIRKIFSPFYRLRLKSKDFTIISNNCWGGIIYDKLGIQYQTPTIGCYFFSNDYIKFISNLKYYLNVDLKQINFEDSQYKNFIDCNSIIGKLEDIEIIFVHYTSFNEAYEKWNRRKKRINYRYILIKYSDQNNFEEKNFTGFVNLNYKNKFFITTNPKYKQKGVNTLVLKDNKNIGYAIDDIKPSLRKISITKLINSIFDNEEE